MLSDAKVTPAIYTGPLTTSIGDGVTELEGRSLLNAARVMLGKAITAADAVGQQTTSSWYTFENGVTVRVARLGGQHIAEFVRHPVVDLPDPNKYAAFTLSPYGGVIVDGYLTTEEDTSLLDRFSPSSATLKRLDGVRKEVEALLETETDPDREHKLRTQLRYLHGQDDTGLKPVPYLSLVVPDQWSHLYNNPVQTLNTTPKVYSQYRLIKPTMFSGRMRVVAQLLMGMGRQNPPTKEQQLAGRGEGSPDHIAVEDYRHDKKGPERSKDDELLGSLDYWFHWLQTHGVYKSEGGRYYLIRISAAGVWAMRLPVLAMSKWALPESAKDYLDDLPLGYGFPTKEQLGNEKLSPWDQAVKDGWVKQIITADDMAPFYDNLKPTYDECGWAFSMSGKKADNVGWKLNAPRPHDYPVFEHWSIEIGGGDGGPEANNKYDYDHQMGGFDKSIESLTAHITKVGKGNAVDISQHHKPFKVPELDQKTGVPGVVSFNMLPRGWPDKGPPPPDYGKAYPNYPVSDTVVHVFYDGEELVWTRFYNPMNTAKTESDSWDDRDYMPYCMLLGGYNWGDYSRSTKLPKGFYSNRVDPRKMADESRTDLQSQGRKTWESPYMGIKYSWPYPPEHFGYEDSGGAGEWYNGFDPSYRSAIGSPWTGKRHCFHVHVWGTQINGQYYNYACAIPMTDREAAFICERHVAETRNKIDYQYAAMVMQFVYYTAPSWMPELGGDFHIPKPPVGGWAWWQLRNDTVKHLVWRFFDDEHNYTNEKLQPEQTVLNIAAGTHTAPTDIWDHGKQEASVEEYNITTLCSTLGGEYPHKMKAEAGASVLWENKLPDDDGYKIAHFWCTRSVVGTESSKMHLYLNGKMVYTGLRADVLTDIDKGSQHRQVTFIGET